MQGIEKQKKIMAASWRTIVMLLALVPMSALVLAQDKSGKIDNKDAKICVVGGGPAGVLTAYELRKKGFNNVTVFEKDDKLGGKCLDKKHDDEIYPLGAVQVGLQYQNFMRLMRELGEPLRKHLPVLALKSGDKPGERKFTSLNEEYWPSGKKLEMLNQARKLYCASKPFYAMDAHNFEGMTPEFDLPYGEFCEKNGITDIQRWYEQYIVAYGYGDLSEIPAAYAIAYVGNPFALGYYMGTENHLRMPKNGYKAIIEHAAEGLNVRTSSPVTQIKRDESGVEVTTPAGTEKFDELFIACPLNALCGKLDMTPEENTLVKNLKFQPYRIVTAYIKNLPKGIFMLPENAKKEKNGHVALISNELASKDHLATFYIPEDVSKVAPRSNEEIVQTLTKDLGDLGIEVEKVVDNVLWDNYFPHFKNPSEMYKVMNDIQGKNHTFQVGSTCKFDIVHSTYEHLLKLLDDKFTGERPSEWFTFQKNMKFWMGAEERHLKQ